jgi:hypothetical protein
MKITQRPIRTTVFFGLICALLFIPLSIGLCSIMSWPMAVNMILWSYLAIYGVLLTRWGEKSALSILFPLVLLLIIIFVVKSNSAFLLFALAIFSWIRSGICFQKPFSRVLLMELFLTLGGTVLAAGFTPDSMVTRALGVWMFFLVQSLYFVFLDHRNLKEITSSDPFEKAMMQAEKTLSGGL